MKSHIIEVTGNHINSDEMRSLTPWQRDVILALREFRTVKMAAEFLGREPRAIRMVILRVRKKGVEV